MVPFFDRPSKYHLKFKKIRYSACPAVFGVEENFMSVVFGSIAIVSLCFVLTDSFQQRRSFIANQKVVCSSAACSRSTLLQANSNPWSSLEGLFKWNSSPSSSPSTAAKGRGNIFIFS